MVVSLVFLVYWPFMVNFRVQITRNLRTLLWRKSMKIHFLLPLCQILSRDINSHGNSVISCHKSTAVWSKPSSKTIPCHLSGFYMFSMLEHDMDFGRDQVMELAWHLLRKWWDFHRVRPNCRPKDMRKSLSHILQAKTMKKILILLVL